MSIPLMFALKDVIIKESACKDLLLDKHAAFIRSYQEKEEDYEFIISEYLRMSGVYWCLTAMDLMGKLHEIDKQKVLQFVQDCRCQNGGFSSCPGHDPHLLHTLSAIQILVLYDSLSLLDKDSVVAYVKSLQYEDGSFSGDEFGEIDTRYSFCAVACLSLLGKLEELDNIGLVVNYVLRCQNFDGGFGVRLGSESHAGQIYCCLGVLSLTGNLRRINVDKLGWWLCERQCQSGGLNGRPEKMPDVCYSWWVLASLAIINRLDWIDKEKLTAFILACQDEETGGFSDRPDDVSDPFHTIFGLAGLALLGEKSIKATNPVLCLPEKSLESLDVYVQILQ